MAVSSAYELFEEFELAWCQPTPPELSTWIKRLPDPDNSEDALQLLQIDIERAWRAKFPHRRLRLPQYESLIPAVLDRYQKARFLCWEFAVRNSWGDCVSRETLCEEFPELRELFLSQLSREIRGIVCWPHVSLLQGITTVLSVSLDRPLVAGRQASMRETPVSVTSGPLLSRIVMCDHQQTQVSRRQLQISRQRPNTVSIENLGSGRSLAVHGKPSIPPGQVQTFELKNAVLLHIYDDWYLRVTSKK